MICSQCKANIDLVFEGSTAGDEVFILFVYLVFFPVKFTQKYHGGSFFFSFYFL